MIIGLSFGNWMSFRDRATFSMVASRERQHGHRVAQLRRYSTRVLPVTAVYGGNASGKTNFFKALSFIQRLVVKGTQPGSLIPVKPFSPGSQDNERPSRFCLELLAGETIYEFSLAVTRKKVLEEKLVAIGGASEKVLYDRRDGNPNFHNSLAKDQFLKFAFQGTRENQLFLTNSVSQNVDYFCSIYKWFAETLILIAPDSRFEPFEQFFQEENSSFYPRINEKLVQLDTGIESLESEEIKFEQIPLPKPLKSEIEEDIKEDMTVRLRYETNNERYFLNRKDGKISARKLVTYHPNPDGSKTRFEMAQESDGTQRVIDLLPAFLDLSSQESNKIYVIDEVDRSLHTSLTRELLDMYLTTCSSNTRKQLLFTTHNVLLMDQQLLRRDEMWVAERDTSGNSELIAFSEYKEIRKDKDIRKSYLQGRLGGVPRILSGAH